MSSNTLEFDHDYSQPADAISLSVQATDLLRREILGCRLRPGSSISEARITDHYMIGRAPTRAALSRLADEGLVRAMPRRGWVVSMVTVRDIHEVFELRLLLEPEAARRAAGQVDDRLIAFDQACAAGYRPADPDSVLEFLAANKAFHVAVAGFAGNARLSRQVDRLLDESTRMLVMGLALRDRSAEMTHEHRALIAALNAGDAALSGEIMHAQVAASRDMVFAALTGPGSALGVSL